DLTRRLGHSVNALEHPPSDEQPAGQAKHDHDGQGPAARGENDIAQPLAFLEIAPYQKAKAAWQLKHADQGVMLGAIRIDERPIRRLGPAGSLEYPGCQ